MNRKLSLSFLLVPAVSALLLAVAPANGNAAEPADTKADIQKTLGFVPQFFLDFPASVLPGTWQEMKSLQLNPATTLPGRTKELIGLGVAAQIPCRYCITAHTEFAKLNGASNAEVGDALAMAAITRHWSTYLNGIQTDEAAFRGEITRIVDNVKKAMASNAPAPQPVPLVDGASALKDVSQSLGYVPEFLKRFPDVARAGAWRTMKEVQMNPKTAVSGKNKELIGLAVAAQVPCKFCVIAHTEFAKLNGASDAEINEAVAMGAFTRHMSTLLNGTRTDEAQFNRDVARLLNNAKAAAKTAKAAEAKTPTNMRPASATSR
jgi:AhpD family alkylhydroperoxidase